MSKSIGKKRYLTIAAAFIAVLIAAGMVVSLAFFSKAFIGEDGSVSRAGIKPILVDDFDKGATSGAAQGRINAVGGYQGAFSMRPSYAIITKSSEQRRGENGKGLSIEYRKEAGWCGWYTLINGIDASRYNTLSFWVKGKNGKEKFDIAIADGRMQELEMDAVPFGNVNTFLRKGVTTEWQEVKIPLARVASDVNLSSLGSIVVLFSQGGEGTIYIDDMVFKDDPEMAKLEKRNAPRSKARRDSPRAMWVWKTDPVNNSTARQALSEFCANTAVKTIYLYIGEFPDNKGSVERLGQFLKEYHAKGIKVEALTGNPMWALSDNHHLAIEWIKPFLEYNKSKPADEMIDGIAFDVEPYLITEWNTNKEAVKTQYISLLKKCRSLIDGYKQEFRLGVAIPMFFDIEEGGEFEKRILSLVDYAALMDYYDDSVSIINNAVTHLKIADEMNKKLVIGIETQDLISMKQGLSRNTFFEEGWKDMEKQLDKAYKKMRKHRSFEGFAIHCYESYRLLQKDRNVLTKDRPKEILVISSSERRSDIVIDGKTDDWAGQEPFVLDRKEQVIYGTGAWKGKDDFCAELFSRWDAENLYFLVKIKDDKLVQEKAGGNMWEGDHIELWLDVDLMGDYNEAVNSGDDFQFGLSPGNFGTVPAEVFMWTPPVSDANKGLASIASAKSADGYDIEVKIPKKLLYSNLSKEERGDDGSAAKMPKKLIKGLRLGISVEPSDCDEKDVPQKLMMSTSKNRVWGDPTTFIILELE